MTAFGYVRKSVVKADAKTHSPEVQEERLRALALSKGDDDVEVISDLDVSGKLVDRPGYSRLVEAIDSGEATAVYAYDLSRLHRNTKEALRFFELCDERRVPVRLVADSIDTSTAMGRMVLTILAAVNQMISDVTSEKIRATFERKRREAAENGERTDIGGWRYGERDGEDPQAVIDAFREAGSYTGAAVLLNERGVPVRNSRSGAVWHGTSVRSVVSRVAPELVLPSASRGSRAGARSGTARFARLLRCGTCGTTMTPSYDRKRDHMTYRCHRGAVVPHPRKAVAERRVLPAIQAEVERALVDIERKPRASSAEDEALMASLDEKRERWIEQYGEGLIDKATRDAKLADIDARRAALAPRVESRHWIARLDLSKVQLVDEGEPGAVNEFVRRLLFGVDLDPQTGEPVSFEWRDPSLRADAAVEE